MFIRIMLSTGVFLNILVLSSKFFVYYIFFRQTFGHDLLLEEQSGTKTLSWHEELNNIKSGHSECLYKNYMIVYYNFDFLIRIYPKPAQKTCFH